MYLLRIAFRNLIRRRGRTLSIASLLALAVVFFLFMESLMVGLMGIAFGNVIDFETPHIEVARTEFFADDRQVSVLDATFVPEEDILLTIRSSEGFVALTPVLDFQAAFAAGRYEFPVRVRSIDPASFGAVFKNEAYLTEGAFVEPYDSGLVIGDHLARLFELEVGDSYTLRLQDRQGFPTTLQGYVKGIASVPHPDMNLRTVLVARDQLAVALGVEEGATSQVMVRMENREQALTQAETLGNRLGGSAFEARSYRDASEFLVSMEAWGLLEAYVILALFLVVGAIGIISAIVLSATERVREIGMMKALGLKESEIVRVFLLEAGGMGAIGAFMGCVLGAVVVFWLTSYGMSLEVFLDLGSMGVPLGDRIYGAWSPSSFVMIFLFVTGVAVAASIVPSYWAARKNPVDAIRHR